MASVDITSMKGLMRLTKVTLLSPLFLQSLIKLSLAPVHKNIK